MMKALGLLFFVLFAVVIGLAIAYWYLRRLDSERPRLRREPRVVPLHEPHAPVDITSMTRSIDPRHQRDAAAVPLEDPDVDGLMRRLAAAEPEHRPETEPAPAEEMPRETPANPLAETGADSDDLKRISGIGPKLERILNDNGITSFGQIAAWQESDVDAMDEKLTGFRGRIRRDDWVGQARRFSEEG